MIDVHLLWFKLLVVFISWFVMLCLNDVLGFDEGKPITLAHALMAWWFIYND